MPTSQGKRQIGMSVDAELYDEWKASGLKAYKVFEWGLKYPNIENMLRAVTLALEKKEAAIIELNKQIQDRNARIEELESKC